MPALVRRFGRSTLDRQRGGDGGTLLGAFSWRTLGKKTLERAFAKTFGSVYVALQGTL